MPVTSAAAAGALLRPMPSSARALPMLAARLTSTLAASVPVLSVIAVSNDADATAKTSFTGSGLPSVTGVTGAVAQRNAVAEVRRQLQLGETAREVHLADVGRRRRLVLVEQLDRLVGLRADAVERAQLAVDRRVVQLDRTLIRFVVLHERRAGRPLVDEQAAEQPGAFAVRRGGAKPRQRSVANGGRTGAPTAPTTGSMIVGFDRLEQVRLDRVARRERRRRPRGRASSRPPGHSSIGFSYQCGRRVRSRG